MRLRLALATLVAIPLLAAPPAHASLRDTCWEVGPTFYLAGIICRLVPADG